VGYGQKAKAFERRGRKGFAKVAKMQIPTGMTNKKGECRSITE
jgi:hypothetical protein